MYYLKALVCVLIFQITGLPGFAQPQYNLKYKQSKIYSGIEVGSKGVKMSILEVGKNAQKENSFNILKDTSVNTDFISFTPESFSATLQALTGLYNNAVQIQKIDPAGIYTVISSGVKVQAEKASKMDWLKRLSDSFRLRIGEAKRQVEIIDASNEARLSHLGIVPPDRRYSTFLIDIGSGNTKGGYFPNGNTKDFKLFELSWGTKSTANAAEKRLGDDKTIENYFKNVNRVLAGQAADEIIYAVNISNAYNMSDYVAFSGGIAWATATLIAPELSENPVIPVTYNEVLNLQQKIYKDYASLSDKNIVASLDVDAEEKKLISDKVKIVNKVFDQKAMLAGMGLLLNVMRQFEGVYEKKQFFLVKNGQVGWISAYVNQNSED